MNETLNDIEIGWNQNRSALRQTQRIPLIDTNSTKNNQDAKNSTRERSNSRERRNSYITTRERSNSREGRNSSGSRVTSRRHLTESLDNILSDRARNYEYISEEQRLDLTLNELEIIKNDVEIRAIQTQRKSMILRLIHEILSMVVLISTGAVAFLQFKSECMNIPAFVLSLVVIAIEGSRKIFRFAPNGVLYKNATIRLHKIKRQVRDYMYMAHKYSAEQLLAFASQLRSMYDDIDIGLYNNTMGSEARITTGNLDIEEGGGNYQNPQPIPVPPPPPQQYVPPPPSQQYVPSPPPQQSLHQQILPTYQLSPPQIPSQQSMPSPSINITRNNDKDSPHVHIHIETNSNSPSTPVIQSSHLGPNRKTNLRPTSTPKPKINLDGLTSECSPENIVSDIISYDTDIPVIEIDSEDYTTSKK